MTLPTLRAERVGGAGQPMHLFPVEGAVVVSEGRRVGRIVEDGIEWIGAVPAGPRDVGENRVVWVGGRWPDRLDVLSENENVSWRLPTYIPLTGKGLAREAEPKSGLGVIAGVATVGQSTLVLVFSAFLPSGSEVVTVRGPKLARKQRAGAEVGCTEEERLVEEAWDVRYRDRVPAIFPRAFGGASTGALVALGNLCAGSRGGAAEVWSPAGGSRVVDLHRQLSSACEAHPGSILKGTRGDLWVFVNGWNPVLHFHVGRFDSLPMPATRLAAVFVSDRGELYGTDDRVVYRFGGEQWQPIARFAEPAHFTRMVMRGDSFWGEADGVVYRLREGAPGPGIVSCAEPFVYLGDQTDVGLPSPTDRSLPAVRRALSDFAASAETHYVEFTDGTCRRFGVAVSTRAVGQALVEQLKGAVQDLEPRLTCFLPTPKLAPHVSHEG